MTHSTSPPSKLTQQPHELHKAVGTLLSHYPFPPPFPTNISNRPCTTKSWKRTTSLTQSMSCHVHHPLLLLVTNASELDRFDVLPRRNKEPTSFFPFPPPRPRTHLKKHFEQALDNNKELGKKNPLTQACNVHHPLLLLVTRPLQA
jgi:hypothetical protein